MEMVSPVAPRLPPEARQSKALYRAYSIKRGHSGEEEEGSRTRPSYHETTALWFRGRFPPPPPRVRKPMWTR